MFDVRARLVAEIDQDIAVGDVDAAVDLLDALRTLPNAEEEVAQLDAALKIFEKVRPMLAKAAVLLRQGKADRPAGGSALDMYHEVQARSEEHTSELQSLMRISYAVFCLKYKHCVVHH